LRRLDKLYIQIGGTLNEYLPYESGARLTRHLPLLDKKIWVSFEVNPYYYEKYKTLHGALNNTTFGVYRQGVGVVGGEM
ncbi:hypothetical protein PENTCL1PPCAC_15359, partial [Pristionchus entomophagus]